MSIYATLWRLQFPRYGDDHTGCEWIEVVAQGVPAHIGTPTPGFGYEREDPYATFLPQAIAVPPDDDGRMMRAVVFVTGATRKGTDRSAQEYVSPLLVLSGLEYATIPFGDLHTRICDALRGDRPRLVAELWEPDDRRRLLFDDGSVQDASVAAKTTALFDRILTRVPDEPPRLADQSPSSKWEPSNARGPRVYQFKVSLMEITPPIWRTIQVPETSSFWELHVALQDVMGWLDYHLHLFRMSKPGTGEEAKIGIPDDDPFEGDEPVLPGWEVLIAPYFSHAGAVARYDYDFGDGWEHEITLEAIVPRRKGEKYPRCLGGARACPPEDCGGVGGYEDLLAVIRDPGHEEHERMLEWLGGRFDPEKFDPKKVTFDDPAKRWQLAFGQRVRPARQVRRTARSANKRPGRPRKRPVK